MWESCKDIFFPDELEARFLVKHCGAVVKGGFHLATAYLHCNIGLKHKKNPDLMQGIAAVLRFLKGPWILTADFNATAKELEQSGWLKLVGGTVVAPSMSTCKGMVIDFFVVSNNLVGQWLGRRLWKMPFSPHIDRCDCICEPNLG